MKVTNLLFEFINMMTSISNTNIPTNKGLQGLVADFDLYLFKLVCAFA